MSIAANPDVVEKIRGGRKASAGFFIGDVMKRGGAWTLACATCVVAVYPFRASRPPLFLQRDGSTPKASKRQCTRTLACNC